MTANRAGRGADPSLRPPRSPAVLLPVVLVAFAANSLITRHVVGKNLLDAGLLSGVRFVAGAAALVALSLARSERPIVGRANVRPALWLGIYAVCISYGYRYIGAAAGTFVFYASVLLTLVAGDLARRTPIAAARLTGAVVSLLGIGVLASAATRTVTLRGVVLLAATGVAWGLYTAAGRTTADPRVATTGHFLLLAAVIVLPTSIGAASGLRVTGSGLAWAVVMGAGTTAFAYVAWYACQRTLSGAAAGSVQLVIPVITAIGAVLLLSEPVSLRLFVAAAMVLAGMRLGRAPNIALSHDRS
ncbi:MAG: DMT family transporter [Mycobacteriales bacterium]